MGDQNSSNDKLKCENVISGFVAYLGQVAKSNQGSLSLAQIEAASEKFVSCGRLKAFSEDCYDDQALMEYEDKRQDVVGRLLVQRFTKLLSKETNPEASSTQMSRWMVPEFLSLVKMMVGEDNYEKYNYRAKQLHGQFKAKLQKPIVWKELFASERAQVIADDILVDVAMVFDPFEQRRNWFINVINTKLKAHPLGVEDNPQRGHWLYQNRHFYRMVDSLFKRISLRLSHKDHQQAMADRYGVKVGNLIALFKEITASKEKAMARKKKSA